MNWRVIYSATAKQDLRDILDYIKWILLAPDAAQKLASKIMGEIENLCFMPERFPVYLGESWRSQGIRYFSIKKYIVFYEIDAQAHTVYIIRIMYGGRDISSQMEKSF